jgi:hypothetical protein
MPLTGHEEFWQTDYPKDSLVSSADQGRSRLSDHFLESDCPKALERKEGQ